MITVTFLVGMPLWQLGFPALCYAVASSSTRFKVTFTKALPVTQLLEMYEVGRQEGFLLFKRVVGSHWCVLAADSWCYSDSAAETREGREAAVEISHHAFHSNSSYFKSFYHFLIGTHRKSDYAE